MRTRTVVAVLASALLVAGLLAAETYIVKVRSSMIRSAPKFFASTVGTVKVGDGLLLIKREADWLQVKTSGGLIGWIHASAVEPRKVDLFAVGGTTKNQATASEVAMAAKGFNKDVEESFKAKNKNISFAWVDKMSLMTVKRADLESFLREGRLGEFRRAK